MKKIQLLILVLGAFALSSCGAFKNYIASYSVGLSSVESPADAKQQFGETKVVTFNEEGVSKYRYEDDYINIVWYVGLKQFNFTLNNKSGHMTMTVFTSQIICLFTTLLHIFCIVFLSCFTELVCCS